MTCRRIIITTIIAVIDILSSLSLSIYSDTPSKVQYMQQENNQRFQIFMRGMLQLQHVPSESMHAINLIIEEQQQDQRDRHEHLLLLTHTTLLPLHTIVHILPFHYTPLQYTTCILLSPTYCALYSLSLLPIVPHTLHPLYPPPYGLFVL